MLMAAGLFGLFLQVRRWPDRLGRTAAYLAQGSFCVYLVHLFVLQTLAHFGVSAAAGVPLLSIPALTLLIGGICLLIYEVLRHIPLVRTYLI